MPWLLIIVGAIFLLENLNLLPWLDWSIVWPALLILSGIYLLNKHEGGCSLWTGGKAKDKTDQAK